MLSRVPFVGLVLTFLAGIWFGDFLLSLHPIDSSLAIYALTAVVICISVISIWFYKRKNFTVFGVLLSAFFFCSGFSALTLHHQDLTDTIQELVEKKYDSYQATVQSIPEKRSGSIRIDAVITRIRVDEKWENVYAKAYLTIPLDASQIPVPGDGLVVNGTMERPKPPLNPEEFDYQRYLRNKNIGFTDYLPDGSYQVIKPVTRENNLYSWSYAISHWSDKQFRETLKDDQSYGLVKAMLLGRRDDLMSDQVDDYTTSGTVHILSVSGMHVAIIFLVVSYLLGWIKRLKGGKYIYLFLVSSLLAFYAMVTGLPPSVQRATIMCIIFVIAEVFSRKPNAINTLAVSALLILLIDPQALFDVGFQLSYLAMAGIFLLYKPLESIWLPSGRAAKYIWQITALSLAAQLATFPLSLYYFHQFPFYFWLVNPFVITFTNFLLPASLLLLFTSLWPFLWPNIVTGWFVQACAYMTNISVAVPKKLPGYLIENLYFDQTEVVLLYFMMSLAWYAYESREYRWLKYSAGTLTFFVLYSTSLSIQTYFTSKGVIHSVPKHAVMSFKVGDKLYISSDKGFLADTDAYKFYIKNYAIREGILKTIFLNDQENEMSEKFYFKDTGKIKLISWQGKTVLQGDYFPYETAADYYQITSPKYPKMKSVEASDKTIFLLGGELKKRSQGRWIALLNQSGMKNYDLESKGALLLP